MLATRNTVPRASSQCAIAVASSRAQTALALELNSCSTSERSAASANVAPTRLAFADSITTLFAALFNDHRAARYLLPLPVIGAGVSIYHLLVENGVVEQTQACEVSAPGGCATKWIDEFGYVTIPTLALTAFALTFAFLLFALLESPEKRDRTPTDEIA